MIDLDGAIRTALKNKDQVALTAYRSVKAKAALKITEPGRQGGKTLTEEEMTALIRKEIRERQEANEFRDPGHPDYAFDQGIIAVLERHLPQQPTHEETDALIQKTITEVRPSGPKEMGRVMAALRQAAPALDMAYASTRVKEILGRMG